MMDEMNEEMEDMEDEMQEDMVEDNFEMNQELQEQYGSTVGDPKYNQHIFLHRAAFESDDTVRTTYLTESELGRPVFSVRFMMDLYKIAELNGLPLIAGYFREKIQNVTHSGMSNKGFAMNLNVTQKRDIAKKRIRDVATQTNIQKGGGA